MLLRLLVYVLDELPVYHGLHHPHKSFVLVLYYKDALFFSDWNSCQRFEVVNERSQRDYQGCYF